MREARIDRDIALALGGWTGMSGSASVSDAYGSGYRVATLKEAIDRVRYDGLDLTHLIDGPDVGPQVEGQTNRIRHQQDRRGIPADVRS